MEIRLPYGTGVLTAHVADDTRIKAVLTPQECETSSLPETRLVEESLLNPINSSRLAELAKGKQSIVIISSDHTRPVPSHIIMPLMLAEIRKGNPEADITILISTGGHRATTQDEIIQRYGRAIAEQEHIVVHDSHNEAELVAVGTLPSGGELVLNKLAMDADLLIAEGFIEPHFFAGFSGGRKSVLPGVAKYETIMANHCAEFIENPGARTGILDKNPIHEDMLYAAKTANLAFICNVVIDDEKKVIASFAGDPVEAHLAGCNFVKQRSAVKAVEADIVITSNGGYPLDQNVYQAVKGMTAGEASVREGGVIILAAECRDGHGGEAFARTFDTIKTPQGIMDQIMARGRNQTEPDQWQIQIFVRVLLKATVIMVTSAPEAMIQALNMEYAASLEEALAKAERILGTPDASITVIPDGVGVIVEN